MARVDPHPTWVRLHSGMNLWGWEGLPVDPTKAKTVDKRATVLCVHLFLWNQNFHRRYLQLTPLPALAPPYGLG